MEDSPGPGKRRKLKGAASRTRSKTLAGVSQDAVDQILTRRQRLSEPRTLQVAPCGAQAELLSEDDQQGSDVEWEAEEMYIQSTTEAVEIDFCARSKRKTRSCGVRLTKEEKQRRLDIEQVCVLCRFVRGLILDKVSDNPILQGLVLSLVPEKVLDRKRSSPSALLKALCSWFNETFILEENKGQEKRAKNCGALEIEIFHSIRTALEKMKGNDEELNIIFACLLKALSYETRTIKVLDFVHMKKSKESKKRLKVNEKDEDQMDEDQMNEDPDLPEEPHKQHGTPQSWCEVWSEARHHDRWTHINPLQSQIDKPMEVEDASSGCFINYVVGYSKGGVRDVGPRYIHNINRIQELRTSQWWTKLLEPYQLPEYSKTELEDLEFEKRIEKDSKITPTTIDGFKKSQTYILERQITKFKGLVPNAKIIGEHRGEPFYLRSDVEELHSVVKWPRQGRVVKESEIPKPWKIVRKRIQPKKQINDELVPPTEEQEEKTELYGYWQTEPWKQAIAKDGIVPRNEYGNVEIPPLVKALPQNTTYLTLPNLGPICRTLKIDFAPALVGFEMVKGGRQVPRLNGIVICSEFEDQVKEAFLAREKARQEALEREREEYARNGWKALLSAVHANIKLHLRYKAKPNE